VEKLALDMKIEGRKTEDSRVVAVAVAVMVLVVEYIVSIFRIQDVGNMLL
jgi:hypothetical protein